MEKIASSVGEDINGAKGLWGSKVCFSSFAFAKSERCRLF